MFEVFEISHFFNFFPFQLVYPSISCLFCDSSFSFKSLSPSSSVKSDISSVSGLDYIVLSRVPTVCLYRMICR